MKKARLIFLTILFILALSTNIYSGDIKSRLDYNIYDEVGVLSQNSKNYIKKTTYDLKKKTKGEIAVVILKNIEDGDAKQRATSIFKEIEIGDKQLDNGILILMAVESRDIQIETGYGTEGFITDAHSARIYRHMAEVINENNDDYEKGILDGYDAIVRLYEKEYNVEIIEREPEEFIDSEYGTDYFNIFLMIVVIIIIISMNNKNKGGPRRRRRRGRRFDNYNPFDDYGSSGGFGGFGGFGGGFGNSGGSSGGSFGGFGGGGSSGGGGAGGKF